MEFRIGEAVTWRERTKARRLKVLDTEPQAAGGGPYREYWVEQDYSVCPPCHAELSAGGKFRPVLRNRNKLAVVGVAVVLVIMIVTLPFTLPHMMSALWMWPGRGGR
ncbi:MAG: hypothetical protein WDN45_06095 [Caulobacteraceae bacterium]